MSSPRRNTKLRKHGFRHAKQVVSSRSTDATNTLMRVEDCRFPLAKTLGNRVHNVIQTGETTLSNSSASVFVGTGLSFSLSSSAQAGSFQALFDQWRIMMVEVTVMPFAGPGATVAGQMYSVIDYDDAATPTSAAQLLQYETLQVNEIAQPFRRCFVPHSAVAAYNGAFTGFQNVARQWCDSASPGIQHYGLKTGTDLSSAALGFVCLFRIWFQFRNLF